MPAPQATNVCGNPERLRMARPKRDPESVKGRHTLNGCDPELLKVGHGLKGRHPERSRFSGEAKDLPQIALSPIDAALSLQTPETIR